MFLLVQVSLVYFCMFQLSLRKVDYYMFLKHIEKCNGQVYFTTSTVIIDIYFLHTDYNPPLVCYSDPEFIEFDINSCLVPRPKQRTWLEELMNGVHTRSKANKCTTNKD